MSGVALPYTEHDRLETDPHHCRALLIGDEDAWIDEIAARYRELRGHTALPPIDVVVEGITILDVEGIRQRVANAQLPETTTSSSIDVVRSDIGELTAYDLVSAEYGATLVSYPIADRELPGMPARGLDAVAVSSDGPLAVYVVEVKLSTDAKSPPGVVEAASDSLWNQHKRHVGNLSATLKKFWTIYARSRSSPARERLAAATAFLEVGDATNVRLIAFSCMVRPLSLYARSDFGPFASKPDELSPATSVFAVVLFARNLEDVRTDVLDRARTEGIAT